jgi:HEAT repeat protein
MLEIAGDCSEQCECLVAILALARVARGEAEVVRTIEDALGQPCADVRIAAAHGLAEIGPGSAIAVDALGRTLLGERPHGWCDYSETVGSSYEYELSRDVLFGYWNSPILASAMALAAIGREAVPALVEGLESEKPAIRTWSAWALGAIGPDAQPAVPYLVRALSDPDDLTRSHAATALVAVGEPGARALIEATTPPLHPLD